MHVYKTSHHINDEILNISSLCWRGEQSCLSHWWCWYSLCLTLCDSMDWSLRQSTLQQGCSVHGISQQEYWSALPFLPTGDLPDQWSEWSFLPLLLYQADSLPSSLLGSPCISLSLLATRMAFWDNGIGQEKK